MNVSATYKAPENPKGTVTLVMDEDTAKEIQSALYDIVVSPASNDAIAKVEQQLYQATAPRRSK